MPSAKPMMKSDAFNIYFWGYTIGVARGFSYVVFVVFDLAPGVAGYFLCAIILGTLIAFSGALIHFYVKPKQRIWASLGSIIVLALNVAYEAHENGDFG